MDSSFSNYTSNYTMFKIEGFDMAYSLYKELQKSNIDITKEYYKLVDDPTVENIIAFFYNVIGKTNNLLAIDYYNQLTKLASDYGIYKYRLSYV